ncbi:MAG TPA: bacteriohemerythrin [Eubacteriaceae bacterium]|nr:bacteriohemerythrin [Eubacteriaceae bacterium]
MIQWTEEYRVGVDFIDEQHQKLFEIARRAFDLMKDEFALDKYDKIVEIIEELKDYTKFHFEAEEAYMEEIGYPKIFSHKVKHEELIKELNGIDFEQVDMNQDEYIVSLLELVVNWIDKHIKQVDQRIPEGGAKA